MSNIEKVFEKTSKLLEKAIEKKIEILKKRIDGIIDQGTKKDQFKE